MKKEYVLLLALLGLIACAQPSTENTQSASNVATATAGKGQSSVVDNVSAKNILAVALGSPDHSTLCAGVTAAGLEDVLVNAGPLTVFAPTNAAFEKLPAGTLEELLKPENKATLGRIIKYHAAPGSYDTNMLKDGMSLFVATGHNLKIEKKGDELFVNGAKILGTVKASNGIVHVIDQVLLPPDN